MATVTASTASAQPVMLKIEVIGLGMTELEAQKFAKSAQCSMSYQLGVEEDMLVVEVTAQAGAAGPIPADARAAFAEQAVQAAMGGE